LGKLVNIAGGAISLFLGLILWITFSVIGGIAAGLGHFDPGLYNAMVASFLLMIGGPAIFWVALPLVERYRRRRKAVEPVTPLRVHFCPGCGAEVSAPTERFCGRCGRRL
jgi:hypothetical protein